jgi:MoaA/NifB/PqqE/SkfB family radical SAM enzyme
MARLFYFTPSYYCTSNCLMCGVAKNKRDERWGYTIEEAFAEVDKMQLRPGDVLEISGGEPTAYKHLDEVCRYASERWRARVLVLSHGRHLKQRRLAERLAHAGIERFLIPIFSHDDERHDYLTQVPGSLQETLAGLDNLTELGVPFSIKFIPMLTNYRDALDTFELCHSRYPGAKFVISGYQMMGEAYSNRDLTSPRHSEVAVEIEKVLELAEQCQADVNLAFVPMCSIDPSFWHRYRSGYGGETVVSPDRKIVKIAPSANYEDKPACCSRCAVRERCQWAWYAYTKVFGSSELKPLAA